MTRSLRRVIDQREESVNVAWSGEESKEQPNELSGYEDLFQPGYALLSSSALSMGINTPQNHHEAMRLPEAESWREAEKSELEALAENGVAELVDRRSH